MMGKSFDSLCFFLILLAAAPHFSRGWGCCKNEFGSREYNTVMECLMAGEESDEANVTQVDILGDCNFGFNGNQLNATIILKEVVIRGADRTVTFNGVQDVNLTKISFCNLTLAGSFSTITMAPEGVNTTLSASFIQCKFLHGVEIRFPNATDVALKNSALYLAEGGNTMLNIQHGTLDAHNVVVECTNCTYPPIFINVCHDSVVKGVMLKNNGASLTPNLIFNRCDKLLENAPTLRIDELSFKGNLARGASWIAVIGYERNGPAVVLGGQYGNNAGSGWTTRGKIFKFLGVMPTVRSNEKSKFTLTRTYEGYNPSWWLDDYFLASTICGVDHDDNNQTEPFTYYGNKLPIGPSNDSMHFEMCTSYCCYYVERSWVKAFRTNIHDCLKDAQGEKVHVASDCPFGEPLNNDSLTFPVEIAMEIAKADTFEEDRVAITLEEGAYQFVHGNDHQMVFTNIHFKKATGAGDGVATVNQDDVTFTNCIFDDDVAKTPPSRVSNGTRFLR
eukprot:TRINITY_DN16530_c1_g1_i1.p1 TRINITY_DN16530_c1_g1~~TRINITY_DN16530_c1_g1_i1.p1  ORF type:complete len:504 (-),score=38.01 TRINITY_DN16530_c1_g1_i1:138-1649(-)